MEFTKTFSESTGLVLRKIGNVLWFFLPLLIILFILFVSILTPTSAEPEFPPIELISDECYITEYYEYLDESTCSIELTFNQNVYEGPITVDFFDKNGKKLETLTIPLTNADYYPSYGTKMVNTYFDVSGEVDSYEIVDYSKLNSAEMDIYNESASDLEASLIALIFIWAFFRCIYAIPLILTALFFSCKSYQINGHYIVVYAGRMHHYIKVDGKKIDEKNSLISFSAINLNAVLDTGEEINVYIPAFTKRMSLRVNGVLEQPSH